MKQAHKDYILNNIAHKSISEIAKDLCIKERKVRKFIETHDIPEKTGSSVQTLPRLRHMKHIIFAVILIAIIGFCAYSNSFKGDYIWDDEYLVQKNVYIKDWANLNRIFTEDFGAGAGKYYGFYRPLQMFTYMIDYSLWGLNVEGYHAVNLFLHILVGIAIYLFLLTLFDDHILALFAAVLFVSHPVHTEAVDYISGRGDPLSVVFMLTSFIFYIKQTRTNFNPVYFILMIMTYSLSLFTKEGSLILPGLILVYHFSLKEKIRPLQFSSIMALVFIYLNFRLNVLKWISFDHSAINTVFQRIPGVFVSLLGYLRLLFMPFDLHMEYGKEIFALIDPRALIGIGIFIILILTAFFRKGKDKIVTFSIMWFFIALLHLSNLYPIAFYMSEHYLYLPSLGFFVLLSGVLTYIYKRGNLKIISIAIVAGLTIFWGILTYSQNLYWSDMLTFYERTLKYAPESSRVNNDLGRLYDSLERYDEAIERYKKAIDINPGYAFPYNNIGVIYNNQGEHKKAIPYFEKALQLKSDYSDAYNNIGVSFSSIGRMDEAIKAYKNAVKFNPNFAGAYSNLGNTYTTMGKFDDAIAAYGKAIEIDPYYAMAYINLSITYEKMQDYDKALKAMKKALELDPENPKIVLRLAILYYYKGDYGNSRKFCDLLQRSGYSVPPELIEKLRSLGH